MLIGRIFIGMHYLIYKITNKLNNKIYVGAHKTENKNDEYFGSGLLLKRSVEKNGKENFMMEILLECSSIEEMFQRESDIVDEDFISRDDTYNIKLGGNGGYGYINKNGLNGNAVNRSNEHMKKMRKKAGEKFLEQMEDEQFRKENQQKLQNGLKRYLAVSGHPFTGKRHSEETRKKMSDVKKGMFDGKKNPAYGKHWITNGSINKLVPKTDPIPMGFKTGRV